MLEKLYEVITYSFRGGVYAAVLISLSVLFLFISTWLYKANEVGSTILLSRYIAQGLSLLALGLLFAAITVWLIIWISDYRSDYLPDCIRKESY